MTPRVRRPGQDATLGNHEDRIRAVERRPRGPDNWPTSHLFLPWVSQDSLDNDYDRVNAAGTSLFGAYAQATGNGDSTVFPIRLGPMGSRWDLTVLANTTADSGIIKYEFATVDDDFYGPGRYPLEADATFITHQARDLWNGGIVVTNTDFHENGFQINGSDGQELTTIGVGAYKQFDGGSGLYLFRIRTDGKNAGSGGFKSQIIAVELRRQPG